MDERDRPAKELLYDTEAALRLVDKALDEICGLPAGPPDVESARPDIGAANNPPPLALVRHPDPAPPPAPPELAAELAEILEDIRLGRALLDRARSRRRAAYAGGSAVACAAIADQYLDGATHLLADLEQHVGRLAEITRAAGGGKPEA